MYTFKEPINRKGVYVWIDEGTDLMCKISTLVSGKTSGFVGITKGHPWYERKLIGTHYYFNDFKSHVYGHCHYPTECKEQWWFWFIIPGVGESVKEEVMRRCRILAAYLEIEGTELAQLIGHPEPTWHETDKNYPDDKILKNKRASNELFQTYNAKVKDLIETLKRNGEFHAN